MLDKNSQQQRQEGNQSTNVASSALPSQSMLNILQVSVNASSIVGSSLVQDSKAYEMDTRVSNHES